MKLIRFLLNASWRTVLIASLVGAVSGGASVALVAFILRALREPNASPPLLVGLFAALCLVVLITRIGSQVMLSRLTENTIARLRMELCRRILDTPLRELEEIGTHRLQNAVTSDVGTMSRAMNGLPMVFVNVVILIGGAMYLASLSLELLLATVAFAVLGIGSYLGCTRITKRYMRRTREAQDVLMKHLRGLIEGIKEMKMHHARRREFVDRVLQPAEAVRCQNKFRCDALHDAAVAWGRLLFFIAIGLLLFAWPRVVSVDTVMLTGYALTLLYLMSPLEQILTWLPVLGWAKVSLAHLEKVGLQLESAGQETSVMTALGDWETIELAGVTHAYRREGKTQGFVLGPVDLVLRPGEIVFVIGGNGSGKTTLAKLLTGLYVPERGEIRLNGRPITGENREAFRQLFSVVFDDASVFESLWGLDTTDLDGRAGGYLRQLQLDHLVQVTDGTLSTTQVSRGQRKRLALLTAYLEDRPIYVFDEWAADQDPVFRRLFYRQLLPDLKRRGKTVVAITHDDRYFDSADALVKLEEGRLAETRLEDAIKEPQFEAR